jgi:hypothetical protein
MKNKTTDFDARRACDDFRRRRIDGSEPDIAHPVKASERSVMR